MKVVVPGGSGHLGTLLARRWHRSGHEVVVLSRRPKTAPWRTVAWDGRSPGDWRREIDGAAVVVNLAGRSVDCRYTPSHRREILDSRVLSTRAVGEAIAASRTPPRLWLQASTATIYAHRFDGENDEAAGILGGAEEGAPDTWRFSIAVARAWEDEVDRVALPRTRRVKLRSAMVMSVEPGGVFDVLLRLVRLGLGGRAGSGEQFVSWIHEEDYLRAVAWLVEHETLEGAVNLAAPNPLPNAQFMAAIRRAWGRRLGLPTAGILLEVGAMLLRTETELILKSRRVVPARLRQSGFEFLFPEWPVAATELCRRWRDRRAHMFSDGRTGS